MLKCDFYMYFVFFDGLVWFIVCVDEVYWDGLDVILLIEYIEYCFYKQDVVLDYNCLFDFCWE